MDSAAIENTAKKVFSFKKPLLIIGLVIIVLAVTSGVLFYLKNNKIQNPLTQLSTKKVAKPKTISPQTEITKSAQSLFTSNKDKGIIKLLQLAESEKNLNNKYSYYLKAYTEMNQAFTKSQDPEIKVIMVQLKNTLKTLPGYKETDLGENR